MLLFSFGIGPLILDGTVKSMSSYIQKGSTLLVLNLERLSYLAMLNCSYFALRLSRTEANSWPKWRIVQIIQLTSLMLLAQLEVYLR